MPVVILLDQLDQTSMGVVLVFVMTFFYLNHGIPPNFLLPIKISLLPLLGDVELFDGILTRGDDDD
jgi:hypothetical protein